MEVESLILFASGRCDIPAFYSDWFYQRIQEGFVDVRNPFNPHQISRIPLTKENIDVIIFCSKNPAPMLSRLHKLTLPYLFHVTITPYKAEMEAIQNKKEVIQTIHTLSKMIGKQRVIVRYDPILLSEQYTIDYHIRAFKQLCAQVHQDIDTVIISFVDMYKNTKLNKQKMKLKDMSEEDQLRIAEAFGKIASSYGLQIQTCAETIDLRKFGIESRPCMNMEDLQKAIKQEFPKPKGAGVRGQVCGCLPSVDIGDYNCCAHHCLYCYANYNEKTIEERMLLHDPKSSVLLGSITEADHITIRKEKRSSQLQLSI